MNFKNLAMGSVTTGLMVFLIVTGFREEARDEQTVLAAGHNPASGADVATFATLASADVAVVALPDRRASTVALPTRLDGLSPRYEIRAVNLTALAPARADARHASMATIHAETNRAGIRPTQ